MNLILWIFAFIGHLGGWCVIYNRTHATNWPRKRRKRIERFVIVAVILGYAWFFARCVGLWTISIRSVAACSILEWLYLFSVTGMGIFFVGRWIWRNLLPTPASKLSSFRTLIDAQGQIGKDIYLTPKAQFFKKIPFNQAHLLSVEHVEIGCDRLPAELDGLKICQISDVHLTGQIDLAYFERAVEEANRFEPDLILVTGDLIDNKECLDWIEPIFGNLKSKCGTFFIRGNHDLKIGDQQMLLKRFADSGMRWVGGNWQTIEIEGHRLSFVGNELPWFKGAEKLDSDSTPEDSFQILLTHSPDQLDWIRSFDFDLIFAGHNHGGQIAFPVVGPIVAPSKYGVLYASGTFAVGSATMHVSRGLSGDRCIRINCPPEVGCFTIRRTESDAK
jgi:predicted MPP superfamily phosphohydrolase